MGSDLEKPQQRTENNENHAVRQKLSLDASITPDSQSKRSDNTNNNVQIYNESNASAALKASLASGKPIISLVSQDGKLSADDMANIKAHGNDAIFVNINNSKATQMRERGMATADFWALANLSGAGNDLNNIKPGFVGKFNANALSQNNPEQNLRASTKASSIDNLFAGQQNSDSPVKRVSASENSPTMNAVDSGKTFNEDNILDAVEAAKTNGKAVVSVNVPAGGLDSNTQAKVDALKNDYNVVLIDKRHASEKMTQGLPTQEFWTLANLMGAHGDVNRIRDNYVGIFTPDALQHSGEKIDLDAVKEGNDAGSILPQLAIDHSPKKVDLPPSDKQVIKPLVTPMEIKFDDLYDFNQGGRKKPEQPKTNDPYDFNQGGRSALNNKPGIDTAAPINPTIKPIPSDKPFPTDQAANGDKPNWSPRPTDGNTAVEPNKDKPTSNGEAKPKDNAKPKDTNDAKPENREPKAIEAVKLPIVKFDTETMAQAIEIAKKNNLPIVFYRGADFCGHCPAISHAVDQFAAKLNNEAKTDAVVVKLNWEKGQEVQQRDPELAQLIDKIMPLSGCTFPDVQVYNPNDLSKPLVQARGDFHQQASFNDLVSRARAELQKQQQRKPR
jgi:thiol-disulfide isomerase/thioredoxin